MREFNSIIARHEEEERLEAIRESGEAYLLSECEACGERQVEDGVCRRCGQKQGEE